MSRNASPSGDPWEEFRRLMPVAKKWAYFDHAAVAPVTGPAAEAIQRWTHQAAHDGDTVWAEWAGRIEQVRDLAASVIGADREEIALVPNTTTGISLVAEGFPWQAGDNVVTVSGEFPSNLYPWIHLADRGVRERRVRVDGVGVDPNHLAEACDERTRIVAVSWVAYATGWRIDVEEMARVAHDHGALLFLDAIQGLGVFPIDVRRAGVDFLAADGHKWLLGPEGAGLLFVRREHLDRLRPLGVGWNSVVGRECFTRIELIIRPEAARYEGGSQNMPGFIGLGASLDVLARLGLSPREGPIARRVLEVADRARRGLERIGARVLEISDPAHRSGIVSFEMPGRDPQLLRKRCREAGVVLSCRAGRLRISPHAYVNEDDVQRLIAVLQRPA